MIDDEDSVQLSEYCFSMCETLGAVTQGMNAEDLNDSALKDLERCADMSWSYLLTEPNDFRLTRAVERALRRVANSPHAKHSKGKFEGYKLEIQHALGTLNAPSTSPDEDSVAEGTDPAGIAVASVAESGTTLITSRFIPLSQSRHFSHFAFD